MKQVRPWLHVALATAALVFGVLGGTAHAAVPGSMAFSGHLADADGPIDGSLALTFRLFDAAVDGTQVWAETQGATAVQGLVLVELGLDTPLSETIFDGSALFLEVAIGGTPLSPRAPIGTVPYAFAANHADSATYAETASQAGDSDQLGGFAASDWQRRVTGTCFTSDQPFVRSISTDGTVTCGTYNAGSGLSRSNTTLSLASLGVTSSHLANGAVTSSKLSNFSVSSDKILNGAVTTPTIADGAVTTAKIADAAVTGVKLADPTIHGPGTANNKRYCALLSFNGSAACTVAAPPIRPGNWTLMGTGCQWICL